MNSQYIAKNFDSWGPAILSYEVALLLIWVPTFQAAGQRSGHSVKGPSFRGETLSDAPKYNRRTGDSSSPLLKHKISHISVVC